MPDRHRDHDTKNLESLVRAARERARVTAAPRRGARRRRPGSLADEARAFGEALGFERPHALHVATLTLSIYDQLAAQRPRPFAAPRSRELLNAAALLHDVGCVVSYARHHKHSFDLIRLSALPGLDDRERGLVALIARYHRKAEPKLKHQAYAVLSAADRSLVRRLAAILRTGDALDRTHTQEVVGVAVSVHADAITFTVDAPRKPVENLAACAKKGSLLESVFNAPLVLRWRAAR